MSIAEQDVQTVSDRYQTPVLVPPRERTAEQVLPLVFGLVLAAVDLTVVVGAFMLVFWLRFIVPDALGGPLGLQEYAVSAVAVAVGTCLLLAAHGLYDEERSLPRMKQLHSVVSALSTALVVIVTVTYFLGLQSFSRLWFANGWAVAVVALVVWRSVARQAYVRLHDTFLPANRVLIVGANPLGRQLSRELADGYHVVGYVDNGSDLELLNGSPLLGPISQLGRIIETYAVDELVIALPPHRFEQVSALVAHGFQRPVQVKIVPVLSEVLPQRFELREMAGRAYIGFASIARVSWVKRALDLVLTSLGLLSIAPVLLFIALLIKLDSPGPVFYRQKRVGKHGRRFWMIKFRSMHQNADRLLAELQARNEATGPLFKMRDDPRVTRIGRILRRLSLDELPQIFNVLAGDMSLVGPRPPLPSEVDKYEDWQLGRLRAVPGMTGLWQVSGRSEVPFHDMVRLDLHYIRNWSFALDLEILLRTIPAVLASRGAY